MEFSLPIAILRSIAVALLLSAAADYSAFDVRDPVAPMEAARIVRRQSIPVVAQKADDQDDRCICCSAGFIVHRVRVSVVAVVAATRTACAHPPLEPHLVRVDPPPRA